MSELVQTSEVVRAEVSRPSKECPVCYGSGHICTRCATGISGCRCDYLYGLDDEEMMECRPCKGTGYLVNLSAAEKQAVKTGVGSRTGGLIGLA